MYLQNVCGYIFSNSSGSSDRVRGGGRKHEIYAAAFGGHLFYDLFSQGRGRGMAPSPPSGSVTVKRTVSFASFQSL